MSKNKNESAAVPALMARVKDNPKDLEAILELGEIFNRAEDWQKSLFFWSKGIELDPENLGARYHRGYALLELQRYEEAMPDYEFIVTAKPDAYQAHYYLGVIYKHVLKNPEMARKHLRLAQDAQPKDSGMVSEIQNQLSDLK
ncbi:MAG: tetratricopeptide repeat protein [Acidobacteriota bacterium]